MLRFAIGLMAVALALALLAAYARDELNRRGFF
jgi:hypothetical protein